MNDQLTLRQAPGPLHAACAWFVGGAEPESWLNVLAQLPLDSARTQILVLPDSTDARRPFGALLVGPPAKGSVPPERLNVLALGLRANRLYLPVDGLLTPPISDDELAAQLDHDSQYVWHPAIGLTRFAPGDVLSPARLVAPPQESTADWNRAQVGVAFNGRLNSLAAVVTRTVEQIMRDAKGEIGEHSAELAQLPPSRREARLDLWSQFKRGVVTGYARLTLWMLSLGNRKPAPSNASTPTPDGRFFSLGWISLVFILFVLGVLLLSMPPMSILNALPWLLLAILALAAIGGAMGWLATRFGDPQPSPNDARTKTAPAGSGMFGRLREWAASTLQAAAESLSAARHRELERLLTALDDNPDEGLRFALPLTGDPARGNADPGARLTTRNVDFRLGAGSGGAADVWDVREEYRQKLTRRYRDLANREISLGRNRRAAYILAELLGDWSAAAKTLADGQHFREAAAIYEQRLHQPLLAAECYLKGGQIGEAIVIYERLNQYETVGDLYRKLDHEAQAQATYRRAVVAKRMAHDRIDAARLLEEKLHAPTEAWEELSGGWPGSPQAQQCLQQAFEWTIRHGDSERAGAFLRQAAASAVSPTNIAQFVGRATRLARDYPDAGVRQVATETTMEVAAARLPNAAGTELEALGQAVRDLAPDDRLLARDSHRYVRERRGMAALAPRPRTDRLELLSQFKTPLDDVRSCIAWHDDFYAAAWRRDHLVLVRGNRLGQFQEPEGPPWPFPGISSETTILLAMEPLQGMRLSVHAWTTDSVRYTREFPRFDSFSRRVTAGNLLGCNGRTVVVSHSGSVLHRVDWNGNGITVHSFQGSNQTLCRTTELTLPADDNVAFLQHQEWQGTHFVVTPKGLYRGKAGLLQSLHEFSRPCTQLLVPETLKPPRLIVCHDEGATFYWNLSADGPATSFAHGLISPELAVLHGNWIVAADRRRCEVYRTSRDAITLHCALDLADLGEIVAVLPCNDADKFSLCDRSGHLRNFRIPPPA